MMLDISLQKCSFRAVPGFRARFSSESSSPPSDYNYVVSWHPCFQDLSIMLFNAGVEVVALVVLEVADDAEALATLLL